MDGRSIRRTGLALAAIVAIGIGVGLAVPSWRRAIVGGDANSGTARTTTDATSGPATGHEAEPGSLARMPVPAPPPDATPMGATRLRGHVTRDGKPAAASIALRLVGAPGVASPFGPDPTFAAPGVARTIARTRAGDDGLFVVNDLPLGRFVIEAVATDGALAVEAVVVCDASAATQVALALRPPLALRGRVVAADGTPMRGTVIVERTDARGTTLSRLDAVEDATRSATLDAEGRFRIEGLTATHEGSSWETDSGAAVRFLDVSGSIAAVARVSLPRADEWVLRLPPPSWVRGRVFDGADRAPIANADVVVHAVQSALSGAQALTASARTRTDAKGAFLVAVLGAPEPIAVTASAPGYAPSTVSGVATHRIALARFGRITGRVIAADGTAVAGVLVHALARELMGDDYPVFEGGAQVTSVAAQAATSGPDGRFALAVAPHPEILVFAADDEWVSHNLAASCVRDAPGPTIAIASGATFETTIVVEHGATIAGAVLDDRGAPVSHAAVTLWHDSFGAGGPPLSGDARDAFTDAAGRFTFTNIPRALPYQLRATTDDGRFAEGYVSQAHALAFESPTLRLLTLRRFTVRVVAADDGAGVEGVSVSLSGAYSIGMTGPDGSATLSVIQDELPDAAIVMASERNGREGRARLVPDGVTTVSLRTLVAVTGHVEFEDGTRIPMINVTLHIAEDSDSCTGRTSENGEFRCDGVPGPGVVIANVDGREIARSDIVAPAHDVKIRVSARRFREAGGLFLRVRGPDGKPPPQVRLDEFGGIGQWEWNGDLLLVQSEQPLLRRLSVGGARDASGTPLPLASALVDMRDGRAVVDVVLPAEQAIEGHVETTAGAPVAGVTISIDSEVTTSDPAGHFRIGGLLEGDSELTVGTPPDLRLAAPVRAHSGARDVVVRLAPAVEAVVTVLDPDGKPVPAAKVAAHDEKADVWTEAFTDSSGRAVLARLDPVVSLVLDVDGDTKVSLSWSAPTWRPADTIVHLEQGLVVAGVVVDRAGNPLAHASIHCRQAGSSNEWTVDGDSEGRFRVERLTHNPVSLCPFLFNAVEDESEAPWTVVEAGRTDVRLVADEGAVMTILVSPPSSENRSEHALILVDGSASTEGKEVGVDSDGSVRLRRCPVGKTLSIWVPPNESGEYVLEHGIATHGERAVRRRSGETIVVRVKGTHLEGIDVVARQGPLAADSFYVSSDPPIRELRGLPPGRWAVRIEGRVGSQWFDPIEVEAQAGTTIDIEAPAPK
jgi:protocatechuate 3,4-dioxygenase beta subunit